ncbi:unnamed protein product [Rotaria sordida]|uniref:Adenine DNA glycosylase n=1 Tax=Rotaria sordida TaxID=392033 RepID=A0A813ZDJ5_9BILA|nr:unnamed protein product [Rotaria sordida]
MISKAVDLVARKLAGFDTDTIARLTQVLSEEAQMISEELQHSGQIVDSDILAAKLEGLVARMKYEIRNQGPDPSPHEFPIFNVSHNPSAPYPNPINHLYDKRYKEAYSTFIKQKQPPPPPPPPPEPSTPTSPIAPFPSKPTRNPENPSHGNYPQGQYQQQSNKQTQQSGNVFPTSHQPPHIGWSYMNPYATMPRSHAAYYQQQVSKPMQTVKEHSSTNNIPKIRRSSTGEDLHSHGLSRSASNDSLNYLADSGTEKIRVRVINDKSASSSTDPNINKYPNNQFNTKKSILKSSSDEDDDNNKQMVTTRRIYTTPDTEIDRETIHDLVKVVDKQQSSSRQSTSSPMKERLGYYNRARNLHKCAQLIINEYNGEFPNDLDILINRLPGVGRYTAGAVSSIAFSQPNPILDGNVIRVLSRMRCIGSDLKKKSTTDLLWSLATDLVCPERPGDFNQSLMELGATVCTPQKPKCTICPVQNQCLAYLKQTQQTLIDIEECSSNCIFCLKSENIESNRSLVENYPRKKTKIKQREEISFILIIYRLNLKLEFLMIKQKQSGLLSGLWSFLEINSSNDLDQMNEHKRKNFIIEQIQNMTIFNKTINIENIKLAGQCRHLFSHIDKQYIIYFAHCDQNEILISTSQMQWFNEEQLQTSAISTAMKKVFNNALPQIKLKTSNGEKNGTLYNYFKKKIDN